MYEKKSGKKLVISTIKEIYKKTKKNEKKTN